MKIRLPQIRLLKVELPQLKTVLDGLLQMGWEGLAYLKKLQGFEAPK
jgi:hypothetical protein